MTQRVLDIVAEDPQVEHVASDVKESSVEEHRREHGDHRWRKALGGHTMPGEAAGHQPELEDKVLGGTGPLC